VTAAGSPVLPEARTLDRLAVLALDFPAWETERISQRPVWDTVLLRGASTHVLTAHDLDELRVKPQRVRPGQAEG